jgi:hypothetical protein
VRNEKIGTKLNVTESSSGNISKYKSVWLSHVVRESDEQIRNKLLKTKPKGRRSISKPRKSQ